MTTEDSGKVMRFSAFSYFSISFDDLDLSRTVSVKVGRVP